ncbi:hypothetical protein LB504_000503 [Fusarium proliferatum]|nr:hypothetical protein LB504_000503 [Fusarium proliferatum]
MAVLDEVPHVTARVRVAGELATEYDPLDDEEAVVKLDKEGIKIPRKVCYVESKSGAEFAIEIAVSDKYQPPNSHDSLIAEVYVDGELRRNKLLEVPLSSSREEAVIISSGRVSPETWAKKPILGKFVFAPINTICSTRTSNVRKPWEQSGCVFSHVDLKERGPGSIILAILPAKRILPAER